MRSRLALHRRSARTKLWPTSAGYLDREMKFACSMAIAVEVAAIVAIPMVVMLAASAITLPVSLEEVLAVVMRPHPMRTGIRRTGPIAIMPSPAVSHGIPVAIHPQEVMRGRRGTKSQHAGRRRRADLYADRNLAEDGSRSQKDETE
jgi:hypothetical protein